MSEITAHASLRDTIAYREIGFCIYCGSKGPELSREHVVPQGLGGKISPVGAHTAAVLGKASCEPCRKITHNFETTCQKTMFGHLRIRLGLSQSDAPETVSGLLRFADGSIKPATGHPDDFPASLVLPVFDKNSRLWLSPGFEHIPVRRFVSKAIFEPRAESPFDAPEVGMEHKLDVEAYQRMIAKIALGSAILKYDTGYFTPLVCDFIRGNETDAVGKYVFGYDLDQESPPFIEGHSILLRDHEHSGVRYVIGFVRLFAVYGTPTNGVIVGVVK